MNAPQFSLGPRDRLWTVLQSRQGHWTSWSDLMFDAGFVPTQRDAVTAHTSFHWHLEQIKSAVPKGYLLEEQGQCVRLSKMPS